MIGPPSALFANREEEYALDNIRDSVGAVASGFGHVLYDGRIHSHSLGRRDSDGAHPAHFRPSRGLAELPRGNPLDSGFPDTCHRRRGAVAACL